MDALHNSHLTGAGTQIRCSRCQMILCNGRCLDCAEDESNPFSFGLPQQVPPTGADEDVVMGGAADVCSGSIDSDEARYFAVDGADGENCDEFVGPRGCDGDIFGFMTMAGLDQRPIVTQATEEAIDQQTDKPGADHETQVIRAGSP